jgi:hypothetical protein
MGRRAGGIESIKKRPSLTGLAQRMEVMSKIKMTAAPKMINQLGI